MSCYCTEPCRSCRLYFPGWVRDKFPGFDPSYSSNYLPLPTTATWPNVSPPRIFGIDPASGDDRTAIHFYSPATMKDLGTAIERMLQRKDTMTATITETIVPNETAPKPTAIVPLPGVGLFTPPGIRTADGFEIQRRFEIVRGPEEAEQMLGRFGPEWKKGEGTMHHTDHQTALAKLWERAQKFGVSTSGILINDGEGYDGVPTWTEITTSHRWMLPTPSPVLEAAHTVLDFEFGHGSTPFDPARNSTWTTWTWIYAIEKGAYRNWPVDLKDIIRGQVGVIEAGAAKGWYKDSYGNWRRVQSGTRGGSRR